MAIKKQHTVEHGLYDHSSYDKGWVRRNTAGFCKIHFFTRAPRGQKPPFLISKLKISFFVLLEVAVLHRSSPFLVCELFRGGWEGTQQGFVKFTFLPLPLGGKKILVCKMKISFFVLVGAAVRRGSHPFLVCELFRGSWGEIKQNFAKFAFWPPPPLEGG